MTPIADIWFHNTLAAHFTREGHQTTFRYRHDYTGPPIATSLPLSLTPVTTASGAIPPFFAGLLPEGRRLSSLRKNIKASADDELSLLLAVGNDPVGAVSIVPHGDTPQPPTPTIQLEGDLDFSLALNDAGIADPVALAGVQDKASARTIAVPIASDAILKLSPPEYPYLVENEAACYQLLAKNKLRIELSKVEVLHDKHGRSGLLVHRFDRTPQGKIPVEDAGQVLGIWPADKYSVSYEEIAQSLSKVCSSPILAMRNLAFQIAVAWLSGNGDLHAKNISIINKGRGFEISPVYDIPSTAIYGDTTMALEIQGSTKDLSKKKFLKFCTSIGLPEKTAMSVALAALSATANAAGTILSAGNFNTRAARDLTRVLSYRRSTWEA
ncbi:putative serine kinase HipA [Corynebacterium suranareeae]|uniref:Putative serine kinase HipA n=1 Tax=Corynebacterium suranareeae TaxID=2506452 RepID=A0A160PNS9_9CORY|nr:HipA domain-containing protein [Corynebacterium suranareeae]BAU95617.1 putative serine kinase HipA [Corynebacterium suranareeae]